MVTDYSVYQLDNRERLLYWLIFGTAIFFVSFLCFNSPRFSAVAVALCLLFQEPYAAMLGERRQQALRKEFVDLVYCLSAAAAVNVSVQEALEEGRDNLLLVYGQRSYLAGELDYILKKVQLTNESEKKLLYDLAQRTGIDDIQSFFEIYYGCRESGGDLVAAVNRASQIISDKLIVENDIKVYISQKKLESKMILLMPIGILFFLRLCSPSYLDPLYNTEIGRIIMLVCLCIAVYSYYKLEKITKVAFEKSIESELPEVLSRISLLLDSGKVFSEVIRELKKEGSNSDNKVLQLFSEAYDISESRRSTFIFELKHLARKTESRELMRTVGILSNNIDKGTELAKQLESEGEMLWHLCKKQVEERGKAAEIKMALPMGAVMLVLIIITTAPALLTL